MEMPSLIEEVMAVLLIEEIEIVPTAGDVGVASLDLDEGSRPSAEKMGAANQSPDNVHNGEKEPLSGTSDQPPITVVEQVEAHEVDAQIPSFSTKTQRVEVGKIACETRSPET